MQDCCKAAPRRARYVAIALVVLGAIALALLERGRAEASPTAPTERADR